MIKSNKDLLSKHKAKMPAPWQLFCPRCERNLNRNGDISRNVEIKEWENKNDGMPIQAIRCVFCKKLITAEYKEWQDEGLIYE